MPLLYRHRLKRSKAETDSLGTGTAGYSPRTHDTKGIANLLNTTERNFHRWAEREKWKGVLETLGYEGDRNFRLQPTEHAVEKGIRRPSVMKAIGTFESNPDRVDNNKKTDYRF